MDKFIKSQSVYRYDTETQLYYLQSRYYNPEWGRFINADGIAGETGVLLSHNMFAYSFNNPVNREDSNGFYTYQIGLGGSLGVGFGVQGEVGVCICPDDLSISVYLSGGALACTVTGGAGLNVTVTNARRSSWLKGNSTFGGASYGPISASISQGNYKNISLGFAKYDVPLPSIKGSAYTGTNKTLVSPSFSFKKNTNNKRGGNNPTIKNYRGGSSRKKK